MAGYNRKVQIYSLVSIRLFSNTAAVSAKITNFIFFLNYVEYI